MSSDLQSLTRLSPDRIPVAPSDRSDQTHTDPNWLATLRRDALASFEEQGLPTRRQEEWKGTNLAPLAAMEFTRVGASPNFSIPMQEDVGPGPLLVFVDGAFDPAASRREKLPAGVRASSLAEVLRDEPESIKGYLGALTDPKIQPLVALQTAFLSDGAVLVLDSGTTAPHPIRLRFISTGDAGDSGAGTSAAFPRLLVIAGEGSSLALVQEHISSDDAPGLTAYVSEFHLAAGARVECLEVQAEAAARVHFTSLHARLEKNATFDSHVITVADGLVRSELLVELIEPNAATKLCGLFMGQKTAHLDHFTTVDHAAVNCTSDEEYRGVLANESKGVFRGRVIVRPGAQGTDTKQSNPNLLLSDRATIDTKPQLEIYADDIRASHGSTIGQLDSDALFFLRARGIDEAEAKRLLTGAYAHGVVARIQNEELRRVATTQVDATLTQLEKSESGRPK